MSVPGFMPQFNPAVADGGAPAEGTYDITSAATTADESYDASGVTGANNLYIGFKPDGTKMFLSDGSTIRRFSLSTPWQVSSGVSYDSNSGSINGAKGYWFKADGTELYSSDNGSTIYQQTLSTPWDLTTLSSTGSASATGLKVRGLGLSEDGTKGFCYDDNSKIIAELVMSTGFDITTLSVGASSRGITGNEGFAVSTDGKHVYSGKASVEQDDFSTAWDASTGSDIGTNSLDGANNRGMFIGDNGNSFYASDDIGHIQRYYLT